CPSEWEMVSSTKQVCRYLVPETLETIEDWTRCCAEAELASQGLLAEFQAYFLSQHYDDVATDAYFLSQHYDTVATDAASLIAACDCLLSMALVAKQKDWHRPTVLPAVAGSTPYYAASGLSHPNAFPGFVPNDVSLGHIPPGALLVPSLTQDQQNALGPLAATPTCPGLILTGSNASGKSTLLRCIALSMILGQMGSYVPAEACVFSAADKVFCRMGAEDDLQQGRSTFLVECLEVSAMLDLSTPHSLCVADEVGRGTSAEDGRAVAQASVRALVNKGCRVLAATHCTSVAIALRDIANVAVLRADTTGGGVVPRIQFKHTLEVGTVAR
ncbi:hypothetical protein KIPB_009045, partial [Kipferlia bialata]